MDWLSVTHHDSEVCVPGISNERIHQAVPVHHYTFRELRACIGLLCYMISVIAKRVGEVKDSHKSMVDPGFLRIPEVSARSRETYLPGLSRKPKQNPITKTTATDNDTPAIVFFDNIIICQSTAE